MKMSCLRIRGDKELVGLYDSAKIGARYELLERSQDYKLLGA